MNLSLAELEFPVRLRTEHPLSDEELMKFCAANELLRIERDKDGDIVLMSPTGTEGGSAELDIATELNVWARQNGRGKVLGPNSGVTLADGSVRAADAAWVSWNKWNAVPRDEQKKFAHLCPEFVIELRSQSDRLAELQDKMQQWLANGVELAWLVDPIRKVVEVYRPNQAPETIEATSYIEGEGPVAGFVLELARIWA